MKKQFFKGIVSSDWNECLAPCGPFDFISFVYPQLSNALADVFRRYTGNAIPLSQAARSIRDMLPGPVTPDQMDAYLDRHFAVYPGVPDLIEWCLSRDLLFMINTTGAIGYFQRVFAKKLMPTIPVLSAHPGTVYAAGVHDPRHLIELFEVQDKGNNTETALGLLHASSPAIVLMGDSGGDGPHFQWGAHKGAFLIGSMTKPSLKAYCRRHDIQINLQFGVSYDDGRKRAPDVEMTVDFRDLIPILSDMVARTARREAGGGHTTVK
jgi:hypothetical protein